MEKAKLPKLPRTKDAPAVNGAQTGETPSRIVVIDDDVITVGRNMFIEELRFLAGPMSQDNPRCES